MIKNSNQVALRVFPGALLDAGGRLQYDSASAQPIVLDLALWCTEEVLGRVVQTLVRWGEHRSFRSVSLAPQRQQSLLGAPDPLAMLEDAPAPVTDATTLD
eukprot:3852871-Alexandrium_andersonii.AAC.1